MAKNQELDNQKQGGFYWLNKLAYILLFAVFMAIPLCLAYVMAKLQTPIFLVGSAIIISMIFLTMIQLLWKYG